MGMVAEWGRGVARAGSVALLIPLGLALGLGLTAALGGGDRLSALGQVVEGPSAPGKKATPRVAPDLAAAAKVPALELPRAPARVVTGSPAPVARRHGGTTGPRTRRPAAPPARVTQPKPATTPQSSSPPPQPSGGGGNSPSQPSTPPSSPVHEVGQQVADNVKKLPAPAGPVAGDTVQTVVDLVAPPPASRSQAGQPHPPQWTPSPSHSQPQPPGVSPTSSQG